jgi:sec-independent protein translocase protein TatA
MFLRGFEGWHLVIIAGLLVVLFGARKLPDSARSIGQSLRIFKSEIKAAHEDEPAKPDSAPTHQLERSETTARPDAVSERDTHHHTV